MYAMEYNTIVFYSDMALTNYINVSIMIDL